MAKNKNHTKASNSNGWHKEDTQKQRRRVAIRHHKGDLLATARGLQYLSNITRDNETARKAQADAHYFFSLYHQGKRHNGRKPNKRS